MFTVEISTAAMYAALKKATESGYFHTAPEGMPERIRFLFIIQGISANRYFRNDGRTEISDFVICSFAIYVNILYG